ncbi:O-acetylserine dependent cystathionine beta-synthase [Caloramator mitchellensis]|uniref:Cysteine synthase n=1 Tax=Caloramator mitchellensis TaxID=908809 RepID=A0A0R3JRR9_CALMK|nr:cysteine synthase A [Caloramator mitchellensis]KRQ86176.1 O-acetylserine dependent cystathionine beta-synthase [Caloramator mitchellensis]
MNYLNDIKELIGNTPILKLNNIGNRKGINIFAKLEFMNPGGSVKDRIGEYMIKEAENEGKLKKGSTIIEATAGNTGIGIAMAALNRGYRLIFVVPEKFSIEKIAVMKALGAEIVLTPLEDGMKGAMSKASELLNSIDGAITLNQFENLANPKAHYETTGREIYDALNGQIDYFVAGAGSGGTFSGVAKYLKEMNPNIKTFIADPIGSTMGGGEEGCYKIEGIGNNFIPATLDLNLVDGFIKISDDEAFEMSKMLAKNEGLLVGSSSGAALSATLKLAEKIEAGNIVTIFPDRGDRYLSKGLY